jgi:hypothetical protein
MLKFGHFALAQYSQRNSSHTESAQSEVLRIRSQRACQAADFSHKKLGKKSLQVETRIVRRTSYDDPIFLVAW